MKADWWTPARKRLYGREPARTFADGVSAERERIIRWLKGAERIADLTEAPATPGNLAAWLEESLDVCMCGEHVNKALTIIDRGGMITLHACPKVPIDMGAIAIDFSQLENT